MVQVADAQSDERIWITGRGERLDHLGEIGEGLLDIADLGASGEAKLCKSLNLAAEHGVVHRGSIASDDAELLQAIDAALCRRGGKSDAPADLARRQSCIYLKESENPLVRRVKPRSWNVSIVLLKPEKRKICASIGGAGTFFWIAGGPDIMIIL